MTQDIMILPLLPRQMPTCLAILTCTTPTNGVVKKSLGTEVHYEWIILRQAINSLLQVTTITLPNWYPSGQASSLSP